MDRLLAINLLGVFDFYLIATFALSTFNRYQQYRAMLGLLFALPERWPRLLKLVQEQRGIFLAWPTMLPIGVTFTLMLANTIAYNFIWTSASVTPRDLGYHWISLILLVVFGSAMLFLDFTACFNVRKIDRPALEKDFDQAEYWLSSWMASAVRIITFGTVDPRETVKTEVQKSLLQVCRDLNYMMWRWALLLTMRLSFGLTLWLTWALTLSLPRPAPGP